MFWKKKKSRKNTYKNNVFPWYVDKMAGEFDTEKFNCGIYGKNGGRNAAVPVAAGETTILSENMRLSIHDEKTHLNNNMFIIADDSYADKLIMANILQCNSSFAVADVGGKMLAETRAELLDAGYDIQVLDVSRPETSAKYNPLRFVEDKKGYNLNVPRYVNDADEEKEPMTVEEVMKKLGELKADETAAEEKIVGVMKELGVA